jgi:hypothetical protein
MLPVTFLRYRKGLQSAEDSMKEMLQDPQFRQEYLAYKRMMEGGTPGNPDYVDADYTIIENEAEDDLDFEDDDDDDDDNIDDIFI